MDSFKISNKKKSIASLIIFLSLAAIFLFVIIFVNMKSKNAEAHLNGFKAGNIMSDYVMSNKNSMSEAQIQNFLKSKNSCNDRDYAKYQRYTAAGYSYTWRDGHFVCMADDNFNGESAAHIIWQTAQDYSINPQVLIVLLQKEQGLITDTWPNHRQYETATGFGCPDTAACDPSFSGLKKQLRSAGSFFREVLNGGWSNYPAYTTKYILYNPDASCGGSNVYIENRATSALYRYTPYQPNAAALAAGTGTAHCGAYGNRNFYNFFTDWFGSTQQEVSKNLTSKATNLLKPGESLKAGEFLTSPNGKYVLVMQYSGQLIMYSGNKIIWQSGPIDWSHENSRATMQSDGNLVVYTPSGHAIWASNTGDGTISRLALQDDGNLVMYGNQGAFWSSNTAKPYTAIVYKGANLANKAQLKVNEYLRSPDWRYYLIMQGDGNLVLYTAGHMHAIWSSNTNGKNGKFVAMQSDGNLVIYNSGGKSIWASDTSGKESTLRLQADGNLVVYKTLDNALWSSDTNNKGGKYISMQTDGNLVMYGDKGAVWASDTNKRGNAVVSGCNNQTDRLEMKQRLNAGEIICSKNKYYKLSMQTDGNLVIYTGQTSATWASNSSGKFFKSNLSL